jgi:hypothetical protein
MHIVIDVLLKLKSENIYLFYGLSIKKINK